MYYVQPSVRLKERTKVMPESGRLSNTYNFLAVVASEFDIIDHHKINQNLTAWL